MKYRLIKKYPGSPELGTIAERGLGIEFTHPNGITNGRCCSSGDEFKILIEDQPEFWQKIDVTDFEILSFKIRGNPHGRCHLLHNGMYDGWSKEYALDQLNKGIWAIQSIKRLSDSQVFTVGDQVRLSNTKSTIRHDLLKIGKEKLGECPEQLYMYIKGAQSSINNFTKVLPSFTTNDGHDVYFGDTFYYTGDKRVLKGIVDNVFLPHNSYYHYANALEHLLRNESILSIEDIKLFISDECAKTLMELVEVKLKLNRND